MIEYLDQDHSGWENNGGGYGEIVIDFAEGLIELYLSKLWKRQFRNRLTPISAPIIVANSRSFCGTRTRD